MRSQLTGRWLLLDGAGMESGDSYPPTTWGKAYKCLFHNDQYIAFEADNGRIFAIPVDGVVLLPENYLGLKEKWKLNKLCTDTEGLLYTPESDKYTKLWKENDDVSTRKT